jgi:hypothetical protein
MHGHPLLDRRFRHGYSNLAYLKRMPLYQLKIAKGFIRGILGDPDGTVIVCSILAMAVHLRLRVRAEEVETEEQARFLAANGAHMQGYLFAQPMALGGCADGAEPIKGSVGRGTIGRSPPSGFAGHFSRPPSRYYENAAGAESVRRHLGSPRLGYMKGPRRT